MLKEKLLTLDCHDCPAHKEVALSKEFGSDIITEICTYTQPAKILIVPAKYIHCAYHKWCLEHLTFT